MRFRCLTTLRNSIPAACSTIPRRAAGECVSGRQRSRMALCECLQPLLGSPAANQVDFRLTLAKAYQATAMQQKPPASIAGFTWAIR